MALKIAKGDHSKQTGVGDSTAALTKKATPASRHVSRSSAFVSLYANDIQIHTSPWDLRFVFGELGDPVEGPGPSINVNQLGEVRISPQFAKKLVDLIITQLAAYEQTFGKIPDIPVGAS